MAEAAFGDELSMAVVVDRRARDRPLRPVTPVDRALERVDGEAVGVNSGGNSSLNSGGDLISRRCPHAAAQPVNGVVDALRPEEGERLLPLHSVTSLRHRRVHHSAAGRAGEVQSGGGGCAAADHNGMALSAAPLSRHFERDDDGPLVEQETSEKSPDWSSTEGEPKPPSLQVDGLQAVYRVSCTTLQRSSDPDRPMLSLTFSSLGLQVQRASIRASAATAEATTDVPTAEVAKLFGRFAEKVLHLDQTVGACCHSACSDCEWRTPDGGYRWDVMKAMQPKWVGCYRERDFEDQRGSHAPIWAKTLFADSDDIGRQEFVERLTGMEYAEAMGPKGKVLDATPSDEVVDLFWETLAGSDAETLSFASMRERLQDMSLDENRDGAIGEGPDMIVWKEFAKGMGCKPFDRF